MLLAVSQAVAFCLILDMLTRGICIIDLANFPVISELREKSLAWTVHLKRSFDNVFDAWHNIEDLHSQDGKRKRTIRETSDYYYTSTVGHRDEVVTSENIHIRSPLQLLTEFSAS